MTNEREPNAFVGGLSISGVNCDESPGTTDLVGLQRMSNIRPEPVDWLWQSRIPFGELTSIEGDPSTNKSLLTIDLASRISRGIRMPDDSSGVAPTGVIFLSGEDSISKTLATRLDAAGANMERIGVLTVPVTLPDGIHTIEAAIAAISARLVIIDPISMYFARNMNNDQSVREALTPLRQLAERTNTAIVLVRHRNKSVRQPMLFRGSGSIGIVAAMRSALLVAKHPNNPKRRLLIHTKSNLGPLAPTLMFLPIQKRAHGVCVKWLGQTNFVDEAHLNSAGRSQTTKLGPAHRESCTNYWQTTHSLCTRFFHLVWRFIDALSTGSEWLLTVFQHWLASDIKARKRRRRRHRR